MNRMTLLICLLLGGCCGVASGPSMEVFKASLSGLRIGMDASDATTVLKGQGLQPAYDSSGNLFARKVTDQCLVEDGVMVSLTLDGEKRVREIRFQRYRIPV